MSTSLQIDPLLAIGATGIREEHRRLLQLDELHHSHDDATP